MNFLHHIFFYTFITLSLWSCASSGTLTGGPKDVTPPKIIAERSDTTGRTRFDKRLIKFEFDEFVDVRDPIKQVFVSPPLKYIPVIKARGKKLTFAFNEQEVLRENTTYTINFGDAIEDYNERNKLVNFKFVFSTGDYIDSLVLKGKVFDLDKDKPAENVIVMVYDNLNDSAIVNEKPYYFSKTNNKGEYEIENIKNDSFKIVVISDENSSYTWNESSENIGFVDSLLFWPKDTIVIKQDLVISTPNRKPSLFTVNKKKYGILKAQYSQTLTEIPGFSFIGDSITYFAELKSDSLLVWYDTPSDSFQFVINQDTSLVKHNTHVPPIDTLILKVKPSLLNPYDSITILYSSPIILVDNNLKGLTVIDQDSNAITTTHILSADHKSMVLHGPFIGKKSLKLTMPKGCVSDLYQNENDSVKFDIVVMDENQLSNLKLTLTALDSNMQYVIRLKQASKTLYEIIVKDTTTFLWEINHLNPEPYSIEVIHDFNRNGKWDALNYWQKLQAEKYRNFPLEKLKENWTFETELNILK